jgi:hypothetical protein
MSLVKRANVLQVSFVAGRIEPGEHRYKGAVINNVMQVGQRGIGLNVMQGHKRHGIKVLQRGGRGHSLQKWFRVEARLNGQRHSL